MYNLSKIIKSRREVGSWKQFYGFVCSEQWKVFLLLLLFLFAEIILKFAVASAEREKGNLNGIFRSARGSQGTNHDAPGSFDGRRRSNQGEEIKAKIRAKVCDGKAI